MSAAAPGLEASGIRSRVVDGVNGLSTHLLEAGEAGRPMLLLLHGFPELAYSWRKVMPALAAAGYHVVAPDQRGYGGTTGWDGRYEADLDPFTQVSLARDAVALLDALGVAQARAVIGHDYGSTVAGHCALIHPSRFGAVVMMSAPFAGAPPTAEVPPEPQTDIHAALAALARPRKLYQWYYSTAEADGDMRAGDLHAFLRAYYHVKSADWAGNRPHPLTGWRADQLALLPDYYVMPLGATMPQAVAPFMPTAAEIAACRWLPDAELAAYAEAFGRTGFQGGLHWYRCATTGITARDLREFAGRTIDIPAMFIGGAEDWGVRQVPGGFEAMQARACSRFAGSELIEGAGHWVQQEQPQAVTDALLRYLAATGGR